MEAILTQILYINMPTYSYSCSDCNSNFELFFYIKDYISNPKCLKCHNNNTYRRYIDDVATQNCSVRKSDGELKTLGDLANRNRDKLSTDEKNALYHRHHSYKETVEQKPLPNGMTRMKKGKKTIWPT
jgi:putative FmdB family regulatory protein